MVEKLTVTDRVAHQYVLDLSISRDELLKYYRGSARQVSVTSVDGQKILFPVTAVQPFVTHEGVCGRFLLQVNSQGRLLSLKPQ